MTNDDRLAFEAATTQDSFAGMTVSISSESLQKYEAFFSQATGQPSPLPYQGRLALDSPLAALLDVPTGLGKTSAAILAWLWRRRFADEAARAGTPRRLVYCLPMRVLVEQTANEAAKWLARLGLLAGEAHWSECEDGLPTKTSRLRDYRQDLEATQVGGWAASNGDLGRPIAVHILLGGEERTDWALWPERDAILIGTQDMLLSRALNRGYAAGRARWPLEFGLLNNDCLWVFDEIQVMDTGLATSLQLDAWRRTLPLRPTRSEFPIPAQNHGSKPCQSLWMSATMAKHWLERAVDWSPQVESAWDTRQKLTESEQTDRQLRSGQLFEIQKQLIPTRVKMEKPKTKDNKADTADAERKQAGYLRRVADHACNPENHARTGLTLIIVNTVDRATVLFDLLRKRPELANAPIKLIHSRFRPMERETWQEFLNRRDQSRRILVSTQVIEAGVDLSAGVLYTELAPWASLVQRFGRCARYPGESGKVFWLDFEFGSDKQPVDHWAKPYERPDLLAARNLLGKIEDVGLKSLTAFKDEIDSQRTGDCPKVLFPYEPRFVPRDKDLFDLFDTTPDLAGADVDISRFIRDGDELDIHAFWRDLSGAEPGKKDRPDRRELCPVPFHRFGKSLPVLRTAGRIWRRTYRKGWEIVNPRDADEVYPGQVYLLEKSCGGYSPVLGWTGDTSDTDFELPDPVKPSKETLQDDEEEAEDLSQIDQWLNVLQHTGHVCRKLDEIMRDSDVSKADRRILRLAGRWHDRGKAHSVFNSKLKSEALAEEVVQQRLAGQPAAKAPGNAWKKNGSRRGFRHELASALAILETLHRANPTHDAFAWPDGLSKSDFGAVREPPLTAGTGGPLLQELAALPPDELDLLVYLVAAHHGKVRMSIRSSPHDELTNVPDPCPEEKKQARGVREGDTLPGCQIPDADLQGSLTAPEITLSLDPMELGLSPRYGASWRERMQLLLERLGPFRLAYLEGLLRAADCRASIEENQQKAGVPLPSSPGVQTPCDSIEEDQQMAGV
jgi:CRISPR-associated endonuclease/helicase Cas3